MVLLNLMLKATVENREKNKGPLIKNEGEFSFDEFSLVARRDTKTIFSTIYISIGGN